jgi:ATP-binding protein involved in chromosome partitioning
MVTEEEVIKALSNVEDPELGRDLVSLGMIQNVKVWCDGKVTFSLVLTTPSCPLKSQLAEACRNAAISVPGVSKVEVNVTARQTSIPQKLTIPGVSNVIAVASGKGGVGKSTVSANLALALAENARIGLLDADIYGPNIPLMMGVGNETPEVRDEKLIPLENYDVKIMSRAFLTGESDPVIWRGPLVAKMVKGFLAQVDWGELDYLIVDLPPGTGDASLTLAQSIPLNGVVIVTTPQDVSLMDAVKALNMFKRLGVPILGIIENMSYFTCPHCGERTEIFDHGGAEKASESLDVPFLGAIPLDPKIRIGGDCGKPVAVMDPESPQTESFRKIGKALVSKICFEALKSPLFQQSSEGEDK